jgi:Zn-finger nucleic acid-binding protein
MDCPMCHSAMITLELADVEIDHCTSCGGIWLDSGELEILLGDAAQAKRVLNSFQPSSSATELPRMCPICDKKMAKVVVGRSDPPLVIDKCIRGDGLWFDRGELQAIVTRADLDEGNRIQRLLADIFGKDREKDDAKP